MISSSGKWMRGGLTLLAVCYLGQASIESIGASQENLTTARDFVRGAYADLDWKSLWVQYVLPPQGLNSDLRFRSFALCVDEQRKNLVHDCKDGLLLGTFTFSADDRLESYFAEGQIVHDKDNERFLSDVQRHPEWSNEMIAQELDRRGARFGPSHADRFFDSLTPGVFRGILGELTSPAAEFTFPDPRRRNTAEGLLPLRWRVTYASSGVVIDTFEFEPFSGQLVSLSVKMAR
jgi:hypothetical protein